MPNELNFKTDSQFENVTCQTNSWNFVFTDKINVVVSGFWRLLEKDKIVLVSLDHGHQFGLPNLVDLQELVQNKLSGKKLIEINVKKDTADLTLMLTDQYKLEIYIASTGYETYELSVNNKRYIGAGGGSITIL